MGIGYWAVFATMAAEQFGTNLRATDRYDRAQFRARLADPGRLGFTSG